MPKKSIEARLLTEEKPVKPSKLTRIGQELAASTPDESGLFYDENGNLTIKPGEVKRLEGKEAMKFLGLPSDRPHCQLIRGDYKRIYDRFKPLIVNYIQHGEDVSQKFWKNITFRVWRIDNIGQKTATGEEYAGDIFDGRALEGFIPQEIKSARHTEYRVQLLSVNVTEDLARVPV